jgi:hypothetical protein
MATVCATLAGTINKCLGQEIQWTYTKLELAGEWAETKDVPVEVCRWINQFQALYESMFNFEGFLKDNLSPSQRALKNILDAEVGDGISSTHCDNLFQFIPCP